LEFIMKRFLVSLLAFSSFTAGIQAQTTYFGDDNPRGGMTNSLAASSAFQAALGSFGTDNIESFAPFTPSPTLTFGGTGVTSTTNVAFVADFTGQPFNYASSGTKALLANMSVQNVFGLSAAVDGFGLFVAQVGDLANVSTLSLVLENTVLQTSHTFPIGTFGPGRSDDNIFFFGVIDSTPFNQVTLVSSNVAGDGMLFDDPTVGFAAVPEPTSLALGFGVAGSVLAWTGLRFYRRKKWNGVE
jgi:hypothetical protein